MEVIYRFRYFGNIVSVDERIYGAGKKKKKRKASGTDFEKSYDQVWMW